MGRESVFKDEDVLKYDYMPSILPHREGQIRHLSDILKLAADGRRVQNVFIHGGPGLGKTASMRHVFREFEDYSGLKTLYVNCWECSTSMAVLSRMTHELGYPAPRHGWSKDEVMGKLVEMYNRASSSMALCLDEADQFIYRDKDALYDLTRINQNLNKPMMIIFISNDQHMFAGAEPRVKSTLNLEDIEFRPYSIMELKDIVKHRAALAFHSVDSGVALLVANTVMSFGSDVRVGLDCLLKAGRLAEKDGSGTLEIKYVRDAVIGLKRVKKEILRQKVGESERIILDILESGKSYLSSELYKEYCRVAKKAVSERMFTNYIDHLSRLNLIVVSRKENVHGFTRIISKAG